MENEKIVEPLKMWERCKSCNGWFVNKNACCDDKKKTKKSREHGILGLYCSTHGVHLATHDKPIYGVHKQPHKTSCIAFEF